MKEWTRKRKADICMGILLQIYFLFPWMNITGERKNFIMYVIAVLRNHSCADTYNTTFLAGAADTLQLDIHTLAKAFMACIMLYVVLEVIETVRFICNIKGCEILIRDYIQYDEDGEKKKEIHVLKGLNFSIRKQEFVRIMGRSGCGKTTLLKLLGMIDRQTGGKLFFEEK